MKTRITALLLSLIVSGCLNGFRLHPIPELRKRPDAHPVIAEALGKTVTERTEEAFFSAEYLPVVPSNTSQSTKPPATVHVIEPADEPEPTANSIPIYIPTPEETEATEEIPVVSPLPEETLPENVEWPTSVEWNEAESRWVWLYGDERSYEPVRQAEPRGEEPSVSADPVPEEPAPEQDPAPTECSHSWLTITHEEVGHYETVNACSCGFQFVNISDYDAHVGAYAGTAEMFTEHGHWGTVSVWIVDQPAYSETQCVNCGIKS